MLHYWLEPRGGSIGQQTNSFLSSLGVIFKLLNIRRGHKKKKSEQRTIYTTPYLLFAVTISMSSSFLIYYHRPHEEGQRRSEVKWSLCLDTPLLSRFSKPFSLVTSGTPRWSFACLCLSLTHHKVSLGRPTKKQRLTSQGREAPWCYASPFYYQKPDYVFPVLKGRGVLPACP